MYKETKQHLYAIPEKKWISHSAKGTSWFKKDAKYIRREKINGKWRYYYNELKKKVKNEIKHIKNLVKGIYNKIKNRRIKQVGIDDEETKNKIDTIKKTHAKTPVAKLVEKKEYKYFKKVQLPNGKWRYFYSQKEYESYIKRNNILDKDYNYMQDVPVLDTKISPEKAAKDADIGTDAGNCGSCSLAFELLMRGYNVKSRSDIDGMDYSMYAKDSFYDFGKESSKYNWYFDPKKKENKDYNGTGFLNLKSTSEEEKLQIVKADLERTIIERGGKDQRGFMAIGWTQSDPDESGKRYPAGGGHIFNYVVENGTVKFYDSQKGEKNNQIGGEIDITEYLDNTNYISNVLASDGGRATYCSLYRVDNKDIKESIKQYISYEPIEIHDEPEVIIKVEKKYG